MMIIQKVKYFYFYHLKVILNCFTICLSTISKFHYCYFSKRTYYLSLLPCSTKEVFYPRVKTQKQFCLHSNFCKISSLISQLVLVDAHSALLLFPTIDQHNSINYYKVFLVILAFLVVWSSQFPTTQILRIVVFCSLFLFKCNSMDHGPTQIIGTGCHVGFISEKTIPNWFHYSSL